MIKADSTLRTSQAVPHPSTNRALRRLTSEVRRDPVHSTRYGRQRQALLEARDETTIKRLSLAWLGCAAARSVGFARAPRLLKVRGNLRSGTSLRANFRHSVTVAILAQGTSWADAVTQASCEHLVVQSQPSTDHDKQHFADIWPT